MPEREVRVVLAAAAIRDIEAIYRRVAEGSGVLVADSVYQDFTQVFERIAAFPESNPSRDHVRPGYRIVPVSA